MTIETSLKELHSNYAIMSNKSETHKITSSLTLKLNHQLLTRVIAQNARVVS